MIIPDRGLSGRLLFSSNQLFKFAANVLLIRARMFTTDKKSYVRKFLAQVLHYAYKCSHMFMR